MDIQKLKQAAAEQAVEYVKPGMIIGLGTGSTAFFAIKKIGELIKSKKLTGIKAIPSSDETEQLMHKFHIPLTTFKEHKRVDLTIDGADEVDSRLNLIKGGGGALLREKILAQASDKFFVVVDESKISLNLGEKWKVPVEIVPFAFEPVKQYLKEHSLDLTVRLNKEGTEYVTDEGNYIIDVNFGVMADPLKHAAMLCSRAGIVEHGLFVNFAHKVFVAGKDGIKVLEK